MFTKYDNQNFEFLYSQIIRVHKYIDAHMSLFKQTPTLLVKPFKFIKASLNNYPLHTYKDFTTNKNSNHNVPSNLKCLTYAINTLGKYKVGIYHQKKMVMVYSKWHYWWHKPNAYAPIGLNRFMNFLITLEDDLRRGKNQVIEIENNHAQSYKVKLSNNAREIANSSQSWDKMIK